MAHSVRTSKGRAVLESFKGPATGLPGYINKVKVLGIHSSQPGEVLAFDFSEAVNS